MTIIVGMADLNTTTAPNMLTTLGLGSCVGIALYDHSTKTAGLAHVMLPDSTQIQNNSNIAKFADTALDKLLSEMLKKGAKKMYLKAKIAGGAQMFAFESTNANMRIGDRNVESVKKLLQKHMIPLVAQDTGLTYGRTVELYAEDGKFLIKTIGHGNKYI
ncbi:putative chemoreceptor glutamine deamidase CheD [Clostridia bacterium]|nr:putative chemoreceptor glutamine deamidase CheD [Clostridia bacterium]